MQNIFKFLSINLIVMIAVSLLLPTLTIAQQPDKKPDEKIVDNRKVITVTKQGIIGAPEGTIHLLERKDGSKIKPTETRKLKVTELYLPENAKPDIKEDKLFFSKEIRHFGKIKNTKRENYRAEPVDVSTPNTTVVVNNDKIEKEIGSLRDEVKKLQETIEKWKPETNPTNVNLLNSLNPETMKTISITRNDGKTELYKVGNDSKGVMVINAINAPVDSDKGNGSSSSFADYFTQDVIYIIIIVVIMLPVILIVYWIYKNLQISDSEKEHSEESPKSSWFQKMKNFKPFKRNDEAQASIYDKNQTDMDEEKLSDSDTDNENELSAIKGAKGEDPFVTLKPL